MARDESGFEVGQAKCIHTTPFAIKCVLLEGTDFMKTGQEFWVPESQIHDDSEVYEKGDEGLLVVTHYIAKKEGWEDDD